MSNYMANLGTMISAMTAAITLLLSIFIAVKKNNREKKKDTLEAIELLQEKAFKIFNGYKIAEIRNLEAKNSAGYVSLGEALAEIEHFCIGITSKIYDFKTFYKMTHGYFDGPSGSLYKRVIEMLNLKLSKANEDYFENIHKVWNKMERINRRKNVGKY